MFIVSELSYSFHVQAIIPQAFHRPSQRIAVLFGVLFLASPVGVQAHDIPNDVTAQVFLKPDGQHLNLLVRVPLKAVRDVVFPARGAGYLDIEKTNPLLPNLAILWISDFIDLREGEYRL